jgi:GT2 family glycosyltransferase
MTPSDPPAGTSPPLERPGAAADLSVVIVSWNVASLLRECIRSVVSDSADLSLQVIVVDNASADESVAMLRREFPWVRLIANTTNLGYARASNQGLRLATASRVLLLNPDTIVTRGALGLLLRFLEDHPEVGMLGPSLWNEDGTFQETSARVLPTVGRLVAIDVFRLSALPLVGRWFHRRLISPYDEGVVQEVQAISGAAMLVRRDLLVKGGGFGECFIHCGEDLDLCYRVRRAGWRIFFVPGARVVHLRGRSARQAPVWTLVNAAISIQCYLERCFGGGSARLYRLALQWIDVPATLLIGLIKTVLRLRPSGDLRVRLQYARGIWTWRPM